VSEDVVEREKEIQAFKATEYWTVGAHLKNQKDSFWAKVHKKAGKKLEIENKAQSDAIVDDLKKSEFHITKLETSERKRNPLPPFITSKLQQEASRKLRYPAKKTMMVAQKLYEGIDLGEMGVAGLITYMRTDSTRISNDALSAVRDHISSNYGSKYLPPGPIHYKSKKSAQDAHEAIRPTNLEYTPKAVKEFLSAEQYKLYVLIWNRFVASQMVPALFDQTSVEIKAGDYELRASGSVLKFDGFTAVYEESKDEDAPQDDEDKEKLPPLKNGEKLSLKEIKPEQHFTQPPPRYTDAST
jgi:DNA topoisomerase-1